MVTGLRAVDKDAPSGECELNLTWATGSEHIGGEDKSACVGRKVVRSVFTRARDMAAREDIWWNQASRRCQMNLRMLREGNAKAESAAMASAGSDSVL
jgi:hypothetical protein